MEVVIGGGIVGGVGSVSVGQEVVESASVGQEVIESVVEGGGSGVGNEGEGGETAANVAISESEVEVSEVEVRSGGVAANVALAESTFIAADNRGGGTSATCEDVSGGIEAEEDDAVSGGVTAIVVGAAGSGARRRGRKRKDTSSTKKSYPKKPKTKKKEEIHDGEIFNPADPESVIRLDGHAICLWKEDDGRICMKVFYDDVKMSRHRTEKHWERSFTCKNCQFSCTSHQKFRRHFLKPGNCRREEHWQVNDGKPHSIRKNVLVENYIPPSSTSSSAAADAFSGSVSSRGEAASVSRPISPQPSTSTGGGVVGSSPILPDPSILAQDGGGLAGSRIPIGEGGSGRISVEYGCVLLLFVIFIYIIHEVMYPRIVT